jgi:NADH-quinone oxidoreductase subunit H
MATLLFMGGWNSPFESVEFLSLGSSFLAGSSIIWLLMKTAIFMFLFLWFRATFPRYRYDQIMRLGWKVFIPITIVWIYVVGIMYYAKVGPWFV